MHPDQIGYWLPPAVGLNPGCQLDKDLNSPTYPHKQEGLLHLSNVLEVIHSLPFWPCEETGACVTDLRHLHCLGHLQNWVGWVAKPCADAVANLNISDEKLLLGITNFLKYFCLKRNPLKEPEKLLKCL